MILFHWLLHLAGMDSQETAFYMFWSGIGPCLVGSVAIYFARKSVRLELEALRLEMQLVAAELERHKLEDALKQAEVGPATA